ncbi:hypothetical protein SKAU_G00086430 [Synaphobranchus kaupii]|uniref:Uncharacterized protein n=1 Tax=Synaphobranchus kaupii TaxID=118154 RepID=A0A9Q1FVU7_SYNKA|nr:hypothetical protein SKAU_G00086430 [Synaphobranchus kaupii]
MKTCFVLFVTQPGPRQNSEGRHENRGGAGGPSVFTPRVYPAAPLMLERPVFAARDSPGASADAAHDTELNGNV